MFQTSLTNWLKKPKASKTPEDHASSHTKADGLTVQVEPVVPQQYAVPAVSRDDPHGINKPRSNQFTNLPPLPSNVTIEPVTERNIRSFRRMNSLLLPIPYSAKFYNETLSDPVANSLTLCAFWNHTPTDAKSNSAKPILIAGIRCRLFASTFLPGPASPGDQRPVLYIATIGTLSPYRRTGAASHLLATITERASREHGISSVAAHVWDANEEGMEWYRRRGFEVVKREDGYYSKLTPSGACLVCKKVGVQDLLSSKDL